MERAISGSIRQCLKTSSKTLRCKSTTRTVCIATSICPARKPSFIPNTTPSLLSPQPQPQSLQFQTPNTTPIPKRRYSSTSTSNSPTPTPTPQPPPHLTPAELHIYTLLADKLSPSSLSVQDISGGCGSMYGIEVESEAFRGLSMLRQQRLVNGVLGEEIKGWHGVQLKCRVPAQVV